MIANFIGAFQIAVGVALLIRSGRRGFPHKRFMDWSEIASGVLLIISGVYVLFEV